MRDRVFVHTPTLKAGLAHKLARLFKGPYWISSTYPNIAEIVPVDKPKTPLIHVAFNRLRRCPKEILETGDKQAEPVPDHGVDPGLIKEACTP